MDDREGYREDYVKGQIERASNLDRTVLFDQEGRCNNYKNDQIPLLVNIHPAGCSLRDVNWRTPNNFGCL